LRQWVRRAGPNVKFINAYGPTETTVTATMHEVTSNSLPGLQTARVPIGIPLANTEVWLLDDRYRPLPVGSRGEIYVGGDSVARGYVGSPDQTAERFIPNPFSDVPGQRLYATGDVARCHGDGSLEFVGRVDQQIKLRGWRVEPQEIERVLEQHPAVTRACIICHEDAGGDKRLIAYLGIANEPAPTEDTLRQLVRDHVARALVPSTFIVLPELPLTPSGKLDRERLARLPQRTANVEERPRVPPRNAIEQAVAEVWSDILGVRCLNVHDDFFAAGGHSLLAMRVVARVRRCLRANVGLSEFLGAPTVAQLAGLIRRRRGDPQVEQSEIIPLKNKGDLPLSSAQESFWRLDAVLPDHHAFTMTYASLLTGPLDVSAFQESLTRVVLRHDILRTTFRNNDGRPVQRVATDVPPFFTTVDLSSMSTADAETHAEQLASRQAVLPFDLSSGSLLRVALIRLGECRHLLAVTMHHIISDGWSMGVFLDDTMREYGAVLDGLPPRTRPEIQYADFATWQRNALADRRFDRQFEYWWTTLGGKLEPLSLPTDVPRSTTPTFITATASILLSGDLVDELRRLARTHGVTMFMIALAALYALLHDATGATDLRVATLTAGRLPGTEELIGLFLNTLVLRIRLSDDHTFQQLLASAREVTLEAYARQEVPFEDVLTGLKLPRAVSVPLFEIMLVMQNPSPERLTFSGIQARPVRGRKVEDLSFTPTICDIVFVISDTSSGVAITAKYKAELFQSSTITTMLDSYRDILVRMTSEPDATVKIPK
jgi:NRPS condensation-like uncharacterized protein